MQYVENGLLEEFLKCTLEQTDESAMLKPKLQLENTIALLAKLQLSIQLKDMTKEIKTVTKTYRNKEYALTGVENISLTNQVNQFT